MRIFTIAATLLLAAAGLGRAQGTRVDVIELVTGDLLTGCVARQIPFDTMQFGAPSLIRDLLLQPTELDRITVADNGGTADVTFLGGRDPLTGGKLTGAITFELTAIGATVQVPPDRVRSIRFDRDRSGLPCGPLPSGDYGRLTFGEPRVASIVEATRGRAQSLLGSLLRNSYHDYTVEVPQGLPTLTIAFEGSGDLGLWVSFGDPIDLETDRVDFGGQGSRTFDAPPAGTLYLDVRNGDWRGIGSYRLTVTPATCVTIYRDRDYRGAEVPLGVGAYDLAALGSGAFGLSSIRTSGACVATLFKGADLSGDALVVDSDMAYVGDEFDDATASLLIGTGACAFDPGIGVTLTEDSVIPPETFVPTGCMSTGREYHVATLLLDGRVLIAGGSGGEGAPGTAEIYDPAEGRFTPTGNMTVARTGGHRATLLGDGRVLITGGLPGNGPAFWGLGGGPALNSAEIFDPATNTFTATGTMSLGRRDHSATLLSSGPHAGKVLIAGGDDGDFPGPFASAELFDPAGRGSFSPAPNDLVLARRTHGVVRLSNGTLLLEGGQIGWGPDPYDIAEAETYDPATETFTATGDMSAGRNASAVALLYDGRVLVVGGQVDYLSHGSVDLYDPATRTFTPTGSLLSGRGWHTASTLPDGRVLVAGGRLPTHQAAASTEIYDPATGTFTYSDAMAERRESHTATTLLDGRILIVGGSDGTTALASAELFNP